MHVTYGRGSVLLWWRSDMLCTSGFMDDVIFAHKLRLLDVAAQLKPYSLERRSSYLYTVSQKTRHYTPVRNFAKC